MSERNPREADAKRKHAHELRMKMMVEAEKKAVPEQCRRCTPWSFKGALIIGKGYTCKHGDYIPYVQQTK